MSSKNAIKMINIQKSYSVHIGFIRSILSSSVQFGSIQSHLVHSIHQSSIGSNSSHSVLFSRLQSNSVHSSHTVPIRFTLILFHLLRSIQSTLTLFGPHWSYSVHFGPIRFHYVYFGSICFYSVNIGPILSILSTLIQFSPIQAIRSTLVLFGPFCLLWFYSVHPILSTFVPTRSSLVQSIQFGPIRSISVPFGPFCPLQSYSVHFIPFGPIQSIQITSIHFGPLRFIFVHLHNGKIHVWIESIYKKNLKLVISKILSITFIIATLLLSHINVTFQFTLIRLNLSESLSKHKDYE